MNSRLVGIIALALMSVKPTLTVLAQNAAFTYQGNLNDGSEPANGCYDLRFKVFDSVEGGSQVGTSVTELSTAITNGLFVLALDFGSSVFNGAPRWLEIEVRTNGETLFVPLEPRQALTPTPYATYAPRAGMAATALIAGNASSVSKGSINLDSLAANSVDSSRIADQSITASDLSPTLLSNTFWRLDGGTGTLHVNPSFGQEEPTFQVNTTNGTPALAVAPNGDITLPGREVLINYRDYGGPPTGVADTDTPRLQAALDAADTMASVHGGNAIVKLEAGTYSVNETLLIKRHATTIRGDGPERTRIRAVDGAKDVFRFHGNESFNVGGTNALWWLTVENLGIEKPVQPEAQSMSAAFRFQSGTAGQQLSRAKFSNIKIRGFYYGIYLDHAVGVLCERIEAYGNNYPFYFRGVDSATFINCFGGDAISLVSPYNNLFSAADSSVYTYIKADSGKGGLGLQIIGGEARAANKVLYATCGNIGAHGLNIEAMPDGPAIQFDGIAGAVLESVRVNNDLANVNNHPSIQLLNGAGARTFIAGCNFYNSATYPDIELNQSNDVVNCVGQLEKATNTATATSWMVGALQGAATSSAKILLVPESGTENFTKELDKLRAESAALQERLKKVEKKLKELSKER